MNLELVALSQDVNLDSDAVEHYFVLKLPNGHRVRALVNEKDVMVVLDTFNGSDEDAAIDTAVEPAILQEPRPVFVPPPPQSISTSAIVAATVQRRVQPYVPKDEWGYPIVPTRSTTRDPGELLGDGATDEFGVEQL